MHCRNFALVTGRAIKDEYVDVGKVRFIYRHFAFISRESVWAGEAVECADEQGRFWDYHDALFENWTGNEGGYSYDNLLKFAGNLGLDSGQFATCLTERRYLDRVRGDSDYAESIGLTSTPTVFINGEIVRGADYAIFKEAIDAALAATGG